MGLEMVCAEKLGPGRSCTDNCGAECYKHMRMHADLEQETAVSTSKKKPRDPSFSCGHDRDCKCQVTQGLNFGKSTVPVRVTRDNLINLPDDVIRAVLSRVSVMDIRNLGSLNSLWRSEVHRLIDDS